MTYDMADKVKDIIANQLNAKEEQMTGDALLREDLNMDSLDAVEIGMTLEETFGIDVSDDDFDNIRTVSDAIKYVRDRSN